MYKILFLALAVFFCVAQASQLSTPTPLFAWAGTTFNSSTNFSLPSLDYASENCVPSTTHSYYVLIEFNITTAGVYNVLALSDAGPEQFNVLVYLYQGNYNPTNSCANYVRRLDYEVYGLATNAPQINDFVYFVPGTYYFVATGQDFSSFGNFAINVFAPTVTGNNFGSTALWNFITYDYSATGATGCDIYSSSYTAPYVRWAWNQTTTGLYDVIVAWERNATGIPDYIVGLLYQGNVTNADIQSQDPCNPASGTVIIGQEGSSNYVGSTIFGVNLTANQVYTLVFSGDTETDFARYGVFVQPSRVWTFTTNPLFTPPSNGGGLFGFYNSCPATVDGTNSYAWSAKSWTNTVGLTTMIAISEYSSVSGWQDTSYVPYTYVYKGVNDGTNTASGAPTACPTPLLSSYSFVGGWQEYLPGLINPVNTTYTLVVQDNDYSLPDATTAAIVFWLTGAPVGWKNSSISTTSTSTTSSSTTSPSSTSSSSSNSTTTSKSSTTSPSSTTSSSSNSSSTTSTPAPSSSTTASPIETTSSGAAVLSLSAFALFSVFVLLF